jgi:hypothetical protein
MKGFKNSTKTQMGHGYADEVPTRPATTKDVAAAKAVRIVTPSKPATKPQPRVTDAMLRGDNEDKAPGERGAKRFAVGGVVPPRSGGMPAQGKPIMNANDARTAPPMQNGQRPMVNLPTRNSGLPQAWRDGYAADSARRLGANPQMTDRDLMNRKADAARNAGGSLDKLLTPTGVKPGGYDPVDSPASRSTAKPSEPVSVPAKVSRPTAAQMAALPTTKVAYKKGGKVVEKGAGEIYASKAAMKKHEGKETKAQERAEHYAKGGSPKSKWC